MDKPDAPVEPATAAADISSRTDSAVLTTRIERAFRKVQDDKDMGVFRLILNEYLKVPRS